MSGFGAGAGGGAGALLTYDWQESVKERWDPTPGLPVDPDSGDRYLATATANGWTVNNIYQWNGTSWTEFPADPGFATYVEDEEKAYVFNGTVYSEFGGDTTLEIQKSHLRAMGIDGFVGPGLEPATRFRSASASFLTTASIGNTLVIKTSPDNGNNGNYTIINVVDDQNLDIIPAPPVEPSAGEDYEVRTTLEILGDVSILSYLGNGVDVSVRSPAGIADINFPRTPDVVVSVSNDFVDNDTFNQYSTIPAATTRAAALITAGASLVVIRMLPGTYTPTLGIILVQGMYLYCEPGVRFDFSSYPGGGPFIRMLRDSGLHGIVLDNGRYGPHPFTGSLWIEIYDPFPYDANVFMDDIVLWDDQGGATTGIQVGPTLGSKANCFIRNSLISLITSKEAILAEGGGIIEGSIVRLHDSKVAALGGDAIYLKDGAGGGSIVSIDMSNSIQSLGGGYDIRKDPQSDVIEWRGSFVDLDNMSGVTEAAGDLPNFLNSGQIKQLEIPHRSAPDPEKYSLREGLNEIILQLGEKEPVISPKNTAFNKDFGTGSGDVCEGDDYRLSDDRDPNAHASEHEVGGGDLVSHDDLTDFVAAEHWAGNDGGAGSAEVWSAQKLDQEFSAILSGVIRKSAVIDYVDATAAPPTEVTGDRYILDFTGGTVHADWDGAAKGDIVQFNGSTWDAETPAEGWTAYVDDENKDRLYVDDVTPDWELRTPYPGQHAIGGAEHGVDTLANLNTKITDAVLDDSGDPRDPNAHAPDHESGGGDEIEVDKLETTESDTTKVLKPDGSDGVEWGDPVAQLFRFNVNDATFPASNPAGAFSRNGHPILTFDDATDENVIFHDSVSNDYAAGNLTVDIDWVAAAAITGDVKWDVSFERITPGGQDIDSDGFAAIQTGTNTTSGTSGVVTRTSITFTQAQADSIAAGDAFRLKITRDTTVGGNMTGDAQILRIVGRQ